MLCIRFAANEGCDISASPAELRTVGDAINRLASDGKGSLLFSSDVAASPEPYEKLLNGFVINVTNGPVRAKVDRDFLFVEGGSEYLARFASFFDFADGTPPGHHNHYEYWDGNPHISADSLPLVISVGGKNRTG